MSGQVIPGWASPGQHSDAVAPFGIAVPGDPQQPLMSWDAVEEILFNGIDPKLKREILAAAACVRQDAR
jgi:hypothetical protein